MKKLVVLLLVSLMATSAFATIDPDPDMLGVYFDATNDMNSAMIAANTPTTMNFVITRAQNQIAGIEFGYRIEVPAGMEGLVFRLSEFYPVSALNVGDSSNLFAGDYIVGYATPIPVTPGNDYTVVSWSVMVLSPGLPVDIFVGPSSVPSLDNGLPAYEIGGTILPLGVSTGWPSDGNPVARINGDAPVAVEEASFGSVKSLFR